MPQEHPAQRVLWLTIEGAGSGAVSGFAVGGAPGEEVDPILDAAIADGVLTYRVEHRLGSGETLRTESTRSHARTDGGKLHGATRSGDPEMEWIGYPAPTIADRDDGSWREGEAVDLLDGESIEAAWSTLRPGREAEWSLRDGVLRKPRDRRHSGFQREILELQAPCRIPHRAARGQRHRTARALRDPNRRRPREPAFQKRERRAARPHRAERERRQTSGKPQTLDVTLIGRDLTVVLNGRKVIDKATVEGLTALATDWREAEPGPITLQGDRGAIEFSKLAVRRLER